MVGVDTVRRPLGARTGAMGGIAPAYCQTHELKIKNTLSAFRKLFAHLFQRRRAWWRLAASCSRPVSCEAVVFPTTTPGWQIEQAAPWATGGLRQCTALVPPPSDFVSQACGQFILLAGHGIGELLPQGQTHVEMLAELFPQFDEPLDQLSI